MSCQLLAAGRWISPGTLVSSANKTDLHDITEILLKGALNAIAPTLTPNPIKMKSSLFFTYCCYSQFLSAYLSINTQTIAVSVLNKDLDFHQYIS
jgi:hypothetical protein